MKKYIYLTMCLTLLSCKTTKHTTEQVAEKVTSENVTHESNESDEVATKQSSQKTITNDSVGAVVHIEETNYDEQGNVKNKKVTDIDYRKNGKVEQNTEQNDSTSNKVTTEKKAKNKKDLLVEAIKDEQKEVDNQVWDWKCTLAVVALIFLLTMGIKTKNY